MKFLSDRMTSASGSIGGTTFSHNRFGMYTRARRVPVNPNTTAQQLARNSLATASAAWRALTAPQRAAWEAYAAATPVTNSLGQTVFLSGAQQYVASASFFLQVNGGAVTDAPTNPGRIAIGSPTIVIDASASTIVIASVASAVDQAVIVQLGDAVSAGVSFFAGPYQTRGFDTPAAGTFTINTAKGRGGTLFIAGHRIPYRLAGVDIEGRLSTIATGIATVVS